MGNRARTRAKRKAAAAVASPPAVAQVPVVPVNVNLAAAADRSRQHIINLRDQQRRTNTKKTLDPKREEFRAFCESEYSCEDAPFHITRDKVWWFMFHQAFRKPKKKGGKKTAPPPRFNVEECKEIVLPFKNADSPSPCPVAVKPVGCECVNQCRKVIKKIQGEQKAAGTSNIGWEFIWDENLKNLLQHVKERRPLIDKANYVEKQC